MTPAEKVKYGIKAKIAHALYAIGLLQLWQRIALRKKAVVLMYHRVLTGEEQLKTCSHPGIVVGCETFSKQMAILKRRFVVLSVEDFASRIEQQMPFDDCSCLITFDDGWRDNFSNAFPILQRYAVPALIFLPVNFIGTHRRFWQEQLTHLTYQAAVQARREPDRYHKIKSLLAPVCLESLLHVQESDLRDAVMEAVRHQKSLAPSLIEKALAQLADELHLDTDRTDIDGFLDWDQVATMSRQGIRFGGHGAEHRLLTNVSVDEATTEIHAAKKIVDSHLGEQVPCFSYPNGNWSPSVVDLAKKSGYRIAFTTEKGFVKCDDDRYIIRRINIHEGMTSSIPMFLARIVGLF
jgi:peptidoglycan/xylan/chitin deacetylase (PgdA/CDA1 family)